jgi:hypothetical protein
LFRTETRQVIEFVFDALNRHTCILVEGLAVHCLSGGFEVGPDRSSGSIELVRERELHLARDSRFDLLAYLRGAIYRELRNHRRSNQRKKIENMLPGKIVAFKEMSTALSNLACDLSSEKPVSNTQRREPVTTTIRHVIIARALNALEKRRGRCRMRDPHRMKIREALHVRLRVLLSQQSLNVHMGVSALRIPVSDILGVEVTNDIPFLISGLGVKK